MATPAPRNSPEPSTRKKLLIAGVAVAAVVSLIGMLVPANMILPIIYFIPLLIFAQLRDEKALWTLAVGLVLLTFALFVVGPSANPAWGQSALVLNRIAASLMIVATTVLLHQQIRAARKVEKSRSELERHYVELEATAAELSQREEEIARQNEELQSQTEELERQGEELRITNEDLAVREKSLEQLLELSRELTSELDREAVLRKVCDSLGALTSGRAAAIVEKRGNMMHVVCHHGFGTDPPDITNIAPERSFAALVLSVGQTGYVEDLRQRSDLIIPQPTSGERFVSVLATPIRVRGRAIGTLEVYSPVPQTWSELQVATCESVAAQLSISLQNAELLQEIEEQRRRFEAAFRSVPVGMFLIADAEGQEIRVNPAGAALLGVPAGDNVSASTPAGMRFNRGLFKGAIALDPANLPTQRVLRGEEVHAEEMDLVLPSGRRLCLVVSAAPFHDAGGKVTGGVAVFVDVTAMKAVHRELELRRREAEEASVRKTRFLAAISHDIRTPANAINLMTELIRRAVATPALASQMPDLAERLQRNVTALLSLVSDLLDLARFDSGKVELVESEFSLNDLLEDEGQQLRPLATGRGVDLTIEPLPRPLWLRTDRVKLARVLGNLIDNAIKFTPAGSVRISAELVETADRRLFIHVADTGIGIPAEHLRQIFDEFLQLRNPERDPSKGSGLGLAICKRLVELLGGELKVASKLNEGTTFTLVLPSSAIVLRLDSLENSSTKRETTSAPTTPRLTGLRVLLVEDHTVTREGTREILLQEGASVTDAANGGSALRLLGEQEFDVVLLDLMLPDMDGSNVLTALQKNRPHALKGVLVLTGDLHQSRLAQLRDFKPDAVIQKPVDVETLVTALQAFGALGTEGSRNA